MLRIYTSIIFFIILFFPKISYAINNISGTYTGTLSGFDTSCINPADDGPFSGQLTITLIGNDAGVISGGSGSFAETGHSTEPLSNITGTNDDTNFAFSFDGTGGENGSIGGTFTSTTLTIITGGVSGGPSGCIGTITGGTLTKVTNSGSTTTVTESTPSTTLTNAILFNTLIQSTVFGISGHVSRAMAGFISSFSPRFGENNFEMGGMTGLNAGDGEGIPYGVWGNYSYTDFDNDLSTTAIDGTSHGFLGGIDFRVGETTILGVALGFDNSDIDTQFNQGNQNSDTVTIAPYFGTILNDTLSMDFSIGYSYVDYDQFRTSNNTRISSTPDADRWFGAFNLNAIKFFDRWIVSGKVGTVYASSIINGYTESDGTTVTDNRTKVSSVNISSEIAYSLNEWEPFLNLAYQYDYQFQKVVATTGPQPANDNDDLLLTTGVRFFEKSGITGNLEYSKRLFREDFDEDRLSLTVRVDY